MSVIKNLERLVCCMWGGGVLIIIVISEIRFVEYVKNKIKNSSLFILKYLILHFVEDFLILQSQGAGGGGGLLH